MTANPMFDLKGRVALVTGSSQGIGWVLAQGLAAAGAAVVVNGRDPAKLARAAAELSAQGARTYSVAFDVTDSDAVASSIEGIESEFGPIDILVNNAGILKRAPLQELTELQWREILETNLTGAFLVARTVASRMIARGSGKIINICSLMSEVGRSSTGGYAAAKGGLKMLTRAMAVEWAKFNLQINGIGPGYIATELTKPLLENPEFDQWIRARTPAARWGRPEDLVGAAVFLASSASDFVNGQIIYVDGGILAAL